MSYSVHSGQMTAAGVIAWAALGEGPHCQTWAAWCPRRWAPVLLKMPLANADDERAIAALAREAWMLDHLKHPAIPRLLDVSLRSGDAWLVTELVEGRTLADVLDHRLLSARDAIRLSLQLASVMRYMHACDAVHLDLKPDNLMLRHGRLHLIDFGAAQRVGDAPPRGPRGTEGYMSETQTRAEVAVDQAMDLWSLGVVLLEARTGARALDRKVRHSWRWRRSPRRWRALIVRLLADDQTARPDSMAEVLLALTELDDHAGRGWAPAVVCENLKESSWLAPPLPPVATAPSPERCCLGLGSP